MAKKNRFIQKEQKQFLFLLILRKSVETVDIISWKREWFKQTKWRLNPPSPTAHTYVTSEVYATALGQICRPMQN